VVVIVW